MKLFKFLFALLCSAGILTGQTQPSYPHVVPTISWKKTYGVSDSPQSMANALDVNNNSYVTGHYGIGTSSDILTLKYDSLGNLIYSHIYDNGGYDNSNSLKIDAIGNCYVAGVSASGPNLEYIIIKLSPTGIQAWTQRYNSGFSNPNLAFDLCIDSQGDVYVTGQGSNAAGSCDIVTLKLQGSTGNIIWTHSFDGLAHDVDVGKKVALSPDGQQVFVAGYSTGANLSDMLILSIDANNGSSMWHQVINGSANGNDYANAMTISGSNLLVCGELDNSGTGKDYETLMLDFGGSILWQNSYDFGNYVQRATSLVADSAGNIAVVGTSETGADYQYHLILYSNAGSQLWVNKESTGLTGLTVWPHVVCDTIAHHFYCSGEKQRTSKDMLAYQITPSGTTSWRKMIDGQNTDVDAATGIAVNGLGIVFIAGMSKNQSSTFDYTTVKISQTPAYFPPEGTQEAPNPNYLYYENKGQVINFDDNTINSDVLFVVTDVYPRTFFTEKRISYKLENLVPGTADTLQRIDINMHGANHLATAYPFDPRHGTVSYMQDILPAAVTGVLGYERFFIPEIYPSIDLHYYSNADGIKIFYVLKPQASVDKIKWAIAGATGAAVVGDDLEIYGVNHTIRYDKPYFYTVDWTGAPVAVATTGGWYQFNTDTFGIDIGSYNHNWPLIIELDYGNSAVSNLATTGNLKFCTYYGGPNDEGIRSVDVDYGNGNFLVTGMTTSTQKLPTSFPTLPGSTLSINNSSLSGTFMTAVVFDMNGHRLAANTYGNLAHNMGVLKGVINGGFITIVGNTSNGFPGLLPLHTSDSTKLTAGTYTGDMGNQSFTNKGYVIQFSMTPVPNVGHNINTVLWRSRLSGFASDIAKSRDAAHLYISSLAGPNNIPDPLDKNGSYFNGSIGSNVIFKISKFNHLGVRSWATFWNAAVTGYEMTNSENALHHGGIIYSEDKVAKCRIVADNDGFYIAGETTSSGMPVYSKYAAPTTTFQGVRDGFFARFNKNDELIYSTYVGGEGDDGFTGVSISKDHEVALVGTAEGSSWPGITTVPTGGEFCDTTASNVGNKMMVMKFDTTGNKVWGTMFGSAYSTIVPWGVTSDFFGKIYITGKTASMPFPNTNDVGIYSEQINKGGNEGFILAFNPTNQPIWSTYLGGINEDCPSHTAFNMYKGLIVAGITNSKNDLNSGVPTGFPIKQDGNFPFAWHQPFLNGSTGQPANADGFIGLFDNDLVVGIEEFFQDKTTHEIFNVFPNPTSAEISIAFKEALEGTVLIELYDIGGKLVGNQKLENIVPFSLLTYDMGSFPKGVYLMKLSAKNVSQTKKIVIQE